MNSVELELLKIDKQWYRQVKENADVRLFVCLGEKHTLKLFDGYFRSHGAEEVETKDLFLVHWLTVYGEKSIPPLSGVRRGYRIPTTETQPLRLMLGLRQNH